MRIGSVYNKCKALRIGFRLLHTLFIAFATKLFFTHRFLKPYLVLNDVIFDVYVKQGSHLAFFDLEENIILSGLFVLNLNKTYNIDTPKYI